MKDFAKSIRTGNEYKPGSYDPKRHEINLWKLDNEIEKWSRTVSTLKQQIAGLERMVSSGEYSKLTNEELKRAKRDQEAAYMRLKQALSMKKRATGNSCVGNGSGSWRGKFYEDGAGNSASIEKRGSGYEVYWEDYKGYGKPLGTYKDEKTAREVAEAAVESEMPDRIRATYKSKAINSKVGNAKKTFSGKYLDIYDDGQVIIKDGWAFGERFNENNFRGWIETQIRLQEHTLQTSKQMRSEFEKNI